MQELQILLPHSWRLQAHTVPPVSPFRSVLGRPFVNWGQSERTPPEFYLINNQKICRAEHSTNREHQSQIQDTKILFPKLYDMECVSRDANETKFHPSIMNRENNLVFNRLRKSLIHFLTQWRSLPMTVKINPFQGHKLHNGPLKGHTYLWYPSSQL